MDLLNNRFQIMHALTSRSQGLGKTALMKYLFVLQEVYNLPLEYEFEIYTYGPYSSEVMEDIDLAQRNDVISISSGVYINGYAGYKIQPKKINDNSFSEKYADQIDDLLKILGSKTAKELELASTIIYMYKAAKCNSWDCDVDTIAADVNEIKPHFSIETISDEYKRLEKNNIFSKLS